MNPSLPAAFRSSHKSIEPSTAHRTGWGQIKLPHRGQLKLPRPPRVDRKELTDKLPFRVGGQTYQLEVAAYYFEAGPRADVGGKRNFVNPEHAVMFLSNGQCHDHWSPADLRHKTTLTHIYDRVLITVDLDQLPIRDRCNMVSAERQGFVQSDDTRRLEQQVIELINSWTVLVDFDREILRRNLAGNTNDRPTIAIAEQIGRALRFRGGFNLNGGNGDGAKKKRKRQAKAELYTDPTTIEGPGAIQVEQGKTRFLAIHVNATDAFMASGRGALDVACDHPEIGPSEITVGTLHNGFVRVSLVVPETAATGSFGIAAALRGWQRAAGGVGPDLIWPIQFTVIEPAEDDHRPKPKPKSQGGESGASEDGSLIGFVWKGESDFEDWHAGVPGHVEQVEARELAANNGYGELARLGATKIPTIFLNRDYAPLKRYEKARADELAGLGLDQARERYAVGAGLGLLVLDRDLKTRDAVPAEVELTAKQAAAQSALVMMPAYDRLAKETGLDGP